MDWLPYLKLPYEEYNCLTLIEKICADQNFQIKGLEEITKYYFKQNWGQFVSYEEIDKFITLNNSKTVSLLDIQEFDVILFKLRDVRPQHLGVYVGLNRFIHHRKYIKIDELDHTWREKIKYIIRWKNI